MLTPKVVGQSGTANPDSVLVTIPPKIIKKKVAPAVRSAIRYNQGLYAICCFMSSSEETIPLISVNYV